VTKIVTKEANEICVLFSVLTVSKMLLTIFRFYRIHCCAFWW